MTTEVYTDITRGMQTNNKLSIIKITETQGSLVIASDCKNVALGTVLLNMIAAAGAAAARLAKPRLCPSAPASSPGSRPSGTR